MRFGNPQKESAKQAAGISTRFRASRGALAEPLLRSRRRRPPAFRAGEARCPDEVNSSSKAPVVQGALRKARSDAFRVSDLAGYADFIAANAKVLRRRLVVVHSKRVISLRPFRARPIQRNK